MSKIIIIEDSQKDQDFLANILKKAGHQVIAASDGQTGISLCLEKRPDIAFLDVMMPDINGIEVLKWIREELPEIKVILCTGAGDGSLVDLAMRLGAQGYIVKPYDADQIFMSLQRIIGV